MNMMQRTHYFEVMEELKANKLRHSALFAAVQNRAIELHDFVTVEFRLPRFAAPSDKFTIPVSVFNTSWTGLYVKLRINSTEGLKIDKDYFLIYAYPREWTFNGISARALGGANKASVTVEASWADSSFSQTKEMPIRPAWPTITSAESGIFRPGTTPLSLPLHNFTGEISGSLNLAPSPAVNLKRALNFLRTTTPYACLEQTISSAWPFISLPDALAQLDPATLNDPAIRENVNGAITRIQSMQLYDGSFAMWPGSTATHNWCSVYATHFLLTAKNAGVPFPDEMLTYAFNWLRQFLAALPAYETLRDEQDDLTTKAYAVYVLALNGERPLGWIEYLREHEVSLRPSGHIYLAGAQSLIDGKADALRTVEVGKNPGWSGRTLESETRNIASLLCMWLDVDPQAPEVTELAQRVVKLGENGGWYSTQDNAAALVALARYNVEATDAKSEIQARVTTETSDKALLTYDKDAVSLKVSDLPSDSAILIEAEGSGQGCWAWDITGYPKSQPKPERRNINVECVYFDEKGKAVDLTQPLPHGSIIQAVLTVKPSMTVNNLVLNYLLPAGLELENPRLEDDSDAQSGGYGIVNDVRDDRLVLYFDRLSGERSYGFKMRAVTRGKFRVPQISAFGMYDAGVRFTGTVQPVLEIK